MRRKKGFDWTLLGTLLLLFFGYLLLFDLTSAAGGSAIFGPNIYDSYSLQARSWLEGHATISPQYTWLELAVYEGQLYVSFPPFPSVVMLPLAALLGEHVPGNLVLIAACLTAVACAYECFRHEGAKDTWAAFWAVFYVMGSNMLSMSVFGGVWFIAQGFNLALTTGAVWAMLCRRPALSLALVGFAVGCRPFSICLLAGLWIFFVWNIWHRDKPGGRLWRAVRILIIPALTGACYMAYNQARFGDPFEFGHNYLPEFAQAELGQFDPAYIGENAWNIWMRPIYFGSDGSLVFPEFDGFMFFVANPLFLVFLAYLIRDIVRRRFRRRQALIVICFAANMLLLLSHKTFGGWQFGARYTVDLLPYALLYLLADGVMRPKRAVLFAGAGAVMLNAYGALALYYLMGA
ncbi:MAG: hypothetical protein HDQ87_00760 [Clostridia bacterium]|nr:hypothetical protein [Clostridia bacterium]